MPSEPHKRLLCVAIDAAAAAFIRPLIQSWKETPPDYEWRLCLSEIASGRLDELLEPGDVLANSLQVEQTDLPIEPAEPNCRADMMLISGGGWPIEHAFVRAARRNATPTLQFIDTWYGYRRRLTSNGDWILPTRLAVIDETARQEATMDGVPSERVVTVGHPSWESVPHFESSSAKNLLFIGAPIERDYGRSLGYTENDAWNLLSTVAMKRPDLIESVHYAPHPLQSPSDLPEGAMIVKYEPDSLQSYGIFAGCFSAPLVDAYLAGRRTVTLQPNASGYDMCALSRHGRIPRVVAVEELTDALSADVPDPSELRAELDGSLSRLIRLLDEVIRS